MQKFAAAIMLAIGALAVDKPYASGEISTKETFKYGRFTANMKPSQAKGVWTAFYLYGLEFSTDPNNLDNSIMEEWSSINYIPQADTPFYTKVSSFLGQSWEAEGDVQNHKGYHKYEIEWTPSLMQYKIDGKEVRRVHSTIVENLREPQNLVMGMFGWDDRANLDPLGNTDLTTAEIDWVEVEDYNEATGKFSRRWRDDFHNLNHQRWAKGDDKSWPNINSTFQAGNVYTEHSKCILEFTEAYHESDDSDEESDDDSHHGSDDESHHGSDHDSDDDSDSSDEESHHSGDDSHEGSDHGSDHGSDDESHHGSDDESHHGSDHDSDHSDDEFHVLPPPKSGSLDMAIEKATRVGVSMVRMQLDNFSNTMSHFLQ